MHSFKVSGFAILLVVGYVSAAAQPLDFEEIGRKIHNFKEKAIPALQGVCRFVNSLTGQPQGYSQGFSTYYPGYQGTIDQGYAQSPRYYPQFPNSFPQHPQNVAPTIPTKQYPEESAFEQEDLLNLNSKNRVHIPPPQIQDVLKNFDKLPKFNPSSLDKAENEI